MTTVDSEHWRWQSYHVSYVCWSLTWQWQSPGMRLWTLFSAWLEASPSSGNVTCSSCQTDHTAVSCSNLYGKKEMSGSVFLQSIRLHTHSKYDSCTLEQIHILPFCCIHVKIHTVTHYSQEHIFLDFPVTTFKFPALLGFPGGWSPWLQCDYCYNVTIYNTPLDAITQKMPKHER